MRSRRWRFFAGVAVALAACVVATAGRATQAQGSDEQQIRERRDSSNAAIARHDATGIGAVLAPNVVVVTSNSVHRDGREANVASFEEQFRTRSDVVYRRMPDEVRVFAPWLMAAERGRWTGSWTDADGKIQLTGSYFAKWRKVAGQWLIESETYVPETCTGGAYCTRVP
jgi:ketosteroid isomerase-like protein